MNKFIHGLEISNYRGIGPIPQRLEKLRKLNILIGANNSGKSAFLAFIANYLGQFPNSSSFWDKNKPTSLDLHEQKGSSTFAIAVPWQILVSSITEKARQTPQNGNQYEFHLQRIRPFLSQNDFIWIDGTKSGKSSFEIRLQSENEPNNDMLASLYAIWQILNPRSSGGDWRHWISGITSSLQNDAPRFPATSFIPAIRQVGVTGEPYDDMSGKGLIDQLAMIQHPGHKEREKRLLFDQINEFLQSVTGDIGATLEIPHDREHILVDIGSRQLPLASLGTGIHEIIMLAAFCTLAKEQIVCIEEPEIHLHPTLQRKLMRYLAAKTSNQYFIASHSAVLIDAPGAAVFHVGMNEGQTVVTSATTPSERHAICADLGYRASDIVQSNSIIWVEGPSDRIYINHWLHSVEPELIEGLHYSIMFYGGKLLSHLTADDEEITEFINLRRLNRHLAVVIDSDRSGPNSSINATKKRISAAFEEGEGIGWITKGREIENYVSQENIEAALRETYPKQFNSICASGTYNHVLPFYNNTKKRGDTERPLFTDVNKVKIAKHVCQQPADLSILDLRGRITDLISMIHRANQ